MLSIILSCLIWHPVLSITLSPTFPADSSTWVGLTKTKKVLGLTQLPKDEYFQGGFLEIVEDHFGPALYFRSSFESTEYALAIPLPFSVCSLTYLNGNFYVIRDDDDDANTTLYTISDYNLVGGYLYWLGMVEEQCKECSNDEIPSSYFDLNNFTPFCNGTVSNSLCSKDLDLLFMKERLSWEQDDLENLLRNYQNLKNKFSLINNHEGIESKAFFWKVWQPYGSSPNRFTSVHGLFLEDVLLVQRPNFIPMVIENFEEHPKPLIVKPKKIRFITLSSFEIGGETYVIGDDVDRKTTIVNYQRGIKFKVGEMYKTFRNIFVVGSSTMIGQDISYDMFSSDNYLPDFIFPLVLCGDTGVPSSTGCLHSYDVKTPFTASFVERRCADDSAKYKEGIGLSSNEVKATDRRWKINENYHSYYIGYTDNMLTYNAAFELCKRYSGDTEAAHLAVLDDDGLKPFLRSHPHYPSSTIDGFWIGGKTYQLSVGTDQLLWLNGKPAQTDSDENGNEYEYTGAYTTFAPHMNDLMTEKCLFLESFNTQNVSLSTSSCFAKRPYICEKYRVCWNIFPNVTIDFEDLLTSPDDESPSVVISLGKVDSTAPDPVQTCSKLCQQRIADGCSAFTYFEEGNGPWSGLCFGRSQYNFTEKSMTPSLLRHSGTLRNCQGGSTAQFETKKLSVSVDLAYCNTTANIDENPKEVISLYCPSGCAAKNSLEVYGDQAYVHLSSVCRAAIHAGIIYDSGGMVTIYRHTRSHTQPGSTKNGISSQTKHSRAHFVFDPTLSISYDPCARPYSKFARSCAPAGTSDVACLARDCCPGWSYDPYNRDCIHKHLSGYLYTDDGWLKSPYSSYEYAVIYLETTQTMDGARERCQKYGEDLAYAGIMEEDSYMHIFDNILYNPHVDNRRLSDSIWIGIIQIGETEVNVGLNQKPATEIGWKAGQPDNAGHKCARFNEQYQALVDSSCAMTFHRALCQRMSYRCDVAVESRQLCRAQIGFKASKAECLAQGCCYVEPLDGNDMCFRSTPKEHIHSVTWHRPAPNNYEYAFVEINGNYEKARIDCLDRGGQLAYEGFNDEDTFGLIRDKLLSPNFALDAAWFGANDLADYRNFTTLNGKELSWDNWDTLEPNSLVSSCLQVHLGSGNWLDAPCDELIQHAVCQRPESVTSSYGKISCETEGFGLCEAYGYTCHKYATCLDHQDWFQCVCDDGYTGDGEICEQLEGCPNDWILEGSSCYLIKVAVASFFEAEAQCQEMGAHLISIHSDEEYQIFEDLVSAGYGANVLFWIGLRWTIPWVSRNGEEYGTCGIWTDGTDCEYNQFVGTHGHECFAYDGSSWINQMCALSLPAASGRSEGFVCKMPASASHFLEVSITSYPQHTYPGLAQIKVNGKDILNINNDTDTSAIENGCIYIVTFSNDGIVINTYSFCNNESLKDNKDLVDKMLKEFMKNSKETYFALATAGRIVYELAHYMYFEMSAIGIPMKAMTIAITTKTVQVSKKDFNETELSSEQAILKCNICKSTCDGVAVFKDKNGLASCRSYTNDGNPSNYQVLVASSKYGKHVIVYRSKVIMEPTSDSRLFCPWLTQDFSTFGIKLTNIVEDKEKRMSTVDCVEPPCVHQMACRLPEMISTSGVYTNIVTEGYLMFCQRLKPFVYTCPMNLKAGFSSRPHRASVKVAITRAPMLATFDDLLHLGSPPFEFGSVYGLYNISWRPMLWTWKNDKHALLVPGVRSRAIRFNGEKVQSPNDLCWWNLGDNATCPHGIAMAFWFKVVEWPDTDQPFINTGAVGALGACKGVVVFITRRNSIMIRVVAEEDVFQIEISVEFRKWTHIWFSWNHLEKKLQIYFDWELKSDTSSRERTLPSISLTCDYSKLSIGSTSGAFDIDDFLIFSHAVENAYELNILLPESTLPLRHRFIEEKSETLPSSKHLGGETCPASEKSYACGDFKSNCRVTSTFCPFSVSCLGSVPFCIRGFSIAFSLKFYTTTNTLRVMLISNLPSKAQNDSYASDNPSYGFRVEATKQPNNKYLVFLWHTMQDDPVPQPRLEFLVDSEEPATFWLQYHPDGMWFFCYRWPNNCLKQESKDIASVDEAFSSKETYTKLAIGPNIIMQDATMSSVQDFIEIFNLWFIEEAFDLVMLADETRMLSSPIRWIPEHFEFTSARDEIPFEKKGDVSKISLGSEDFYGWQVNIENPEGSVKTGLDAGNKLETLVGWMEIDQNAISNDCLFDIDKCQNGFTFQVWIKTADCVELVSGENACYYVSTGGQSTPLSRGFAIFRTADDGIYHVIVSTSTKIWKLDFEADFSSYYTLLRISWHLNIGLSLFLNDIPVQRSILTQPVIEPDVEDIDAYRKFKPFHTLTIGRRDDLMQGFSTFHLGEMFFWDGLVEGFPSQSIGKRCVKPWHQIGESCYLVAASDGGTQAQTEAICRSMKSELAHVPSFSAFQGLRRYLLTQSSSLSKLRMGLVADSWPSWENLQWMYLGLPVNTFNFNAIASMGWDASTQSAVFALSRSSSGYGRVEFNFVNPISMTANGFVCAMPLSQDYFHRGCYTPEMEANKFGFDDSSGLALHNVSGQVSPNVVNSLGSYDIPNSCRRFCSLEHGSILAVIRNYKCYCLDKAATMNDFISQSSSIVDKYSCSALTNFYIAEKFEFGFSKLNNQPETLQYRKPSRNRNCGTFENGGVYKCGAEERAAFYGFHENFFIQVYSLSPIKTVDVFTGFESKPKITLLTHEELTIRTRNYECEEKEFQQDLTNMTCINSTVKLSIDFGDGSVYENNMPLSEAENFTFLHFFNTSGNFVLSINIKNSIIKSFNWKKDITVTPRPESVELSHIEMVVTKPDEMAEFTTEALQGTNFKCSWEYNDGSPEEEASFQNTPIAKKFHRFKSSGVYTVQAHCWNALSNRTVESLAVVHQPIIGLSAIDDVVVSYGDEYMHTWEILQGSHVSCNVFIGSQSVKELSLKPESGGEVSFFYDSNINQGYALLPCPQNEDQCFLPNKVTSYVVVVVCYNAITDPSPVAVTYVIVEKPIQTLNTNISEEVTFLEPHQTFCASITVVGGSNVIIVLDKDDDTIPPDDVFDYCGEEECDDRTFCLSYQDPMKHTLRVKAFNSHGIEEKVITISVMLPILKVVVDLIPATQPYQQSEIILSHDSPLPTGEVQIDYGDGITEYAELLFNKISSKMNLFHSYPEIGSYNITFHINNNVSSFLFDKKIRIGIPIEDVELKVTSKLHVRSQSEPVVFLVSTSRGSEPKYRIDFGDDAKPSGLKPSSLHFVESSSRKDPETPDTHYIEHIYDHPGNYVASVYVENLFGNIQAVCTETVVVQNPLTGSKYQLKENELLPVAIPTGTASFNAHLVQSNAFDLLPLEVDPVGWANDVHVSWIQALPSEKVVLHQSFGTHDIDLFPENITFIESDIGDVSVYARLWNLVSEVELHFPFKLVERIDGIQVEVRNIENIGVVEDLDGRFVDVSTLHELTFKLTISKGSHVTYFIDFGDGSSDAKESPLLLGKGVFVEFTHSYKANGTYTINVTVSNDVGSHSRSYVDAVRVYDKVSGLKELIETVDFDEEISGIDILKESSEFYALAYGKPGHQSGDELFFPSNRPIHFRVGIEVGSNVSISWTFINYNVTINISDTANPTAFDSQTYAEYVIEDNMISIADLQIKLLEKPNENDLRHLTDEQIVQIHNYRTESALLLRFSKPCEEVAKIEISNPISYKSVLKNFYLKTVVEGVSFENFEPPIVNKTSNISLTVNQVGSESCFVLDPGDLTYEVAFGFDSTSCVGKPGIKPDMFYELNEDISQYKAVEFSSFSFVGDPTQGLAQLNFTLSHVYSKMRFYKIKLLAFNFLSSLEISRDVTVTEILCDFPHVSIEKPNGNSLMSPRKALSFIELRLYTLIRANCKITSLTDIHWSAYEVKEVDLSLFRVDKTTEEDGYGKLPSPASKFSSVRHSYREIPGLIYTSNSEDITIKPRFLKLGMHLVCVNVAMVDVVGINTTDCIYIQSILPPLVAGIALGIRRAVGFGSLISMDAASASYDPDRQTMEDVQDSATRDISNLQFKMSCPFVVFNNSADQESQDEKILMFSDIHDWRTETYANNEIISMNCTNSFHAVHFQSARLINSNLEILNVNSGSSINNLERFPCFGMNKCHMTVEEWLANYFDNGQNPSPANTTTYSLEITMRCQVPESNKRFEYIQSNKSNNSCTTSGYYPTQQQSLNVACSAVTSRTFPQCGGIEIDTNRLKPNLSYMVRVLLTDTNSTRFAIGSQVIQFTFKPPPEIKIKCLVNCDMKVNPRAAISVEAIAINETSSITYEWTLLEVRDKTRRRRDLDDNVDLHPVEGFEQFSSVGIHDKYFVIQPGLLLPSVQYRIRVTGAVVGAFPGLTEIELSLNLPPYNGDCTIDPKEGTSVNDTFRVSCLGWKDEGINVDRNAYLSPNEYSLSYQVYYRRVADGLNSLLLYGSEATISDLFLPPGLSENDFKIWVEVRIIDEYGAQAAVNLTATVYGDSEFSDEMLKNISSIEIATSSAQNIAQISASVSEILNEKANTSVKLSSKSSEEIQAEVQERASLRGDLVNAVVEKINKDGDIDGIKQACSTLNSLTTVPDEVSSDTQVVAADALSERANLLSKLSESKPSVEVEEAANVMVVGLENVVKSAQTQMLANLDEADSSTSLVKRPIFSEQTPPIISSKIILDEEEEYLSPEERQERRTVHSKSKSEKRLKNSNQTKEIGMKAITSMNSLSGSLLRKKVPGEPAVVLRSKGINMQVQKNKAADICRALTQNITSNSTPSALTSILLNSNVNMGDCNSTSDEEAIETELTTLDDNPFVWDGSADFVRSSVVSLTFKFQNGTKPFQGENNTFRLELPVNPTLSSVAPQFFEFKPSSGSENMSFHELSVAQLDSVTFLTINPHNASESSGIKMKVYFLVANSTNNLKMYPNTTNYTFVRDLPDYESDYNNPYRLRLDESVIDRVGRYVFGILQVDDVGNITLEANRTLRNYTLHNMATSCRFWNETTEKWETAGCRVSSETSTETVVCLCNHLTSFGADFLVAPNPIDFSRLGEKLDVAKNPAVLSTIICVFALYVIGLVGCRRQDKKDVSKWSVSLLLDNNMCDHYFYQITIQTGGKREAETSSRVFFMISGDEGDTELRVLADKEKTVFGRGSTRKFLMAVNKPLGVLSFLKIWHDNSGKKSMASWYLDHVIVSDLRTKTRYYFFCNDWLAVDQSDGLVERILPVATDNQLGSFKRVFASSTKRDFSDGHLWFSLISRPTKSSFTRVQRLTCALAILFSTMLTSAMFFGRDEGGTSQGILEIGPIKITIQQLMVSVQAAFIVLPVNILLVQLFRRAKPKGEDNETMGVMNLLTKSVESIDKELDEKDGKQNNSGFQLPYWAVYVAWCLAAVVSLISATFIFLYSIEWGATKSNEWLLSIFLSFFQSIFVIQPAKVILAAILFSFFINRCQKGKAEEIIGGNEDAQGANCGDAEEFKKKEEEWLLQTPKDDHFADLESRKCTVSKRELETARKERLRQRIMVNTIHDVLLYLLYVVLLITAANSSKDPQAFRFHSSLTDVFLAKGEPVFEQIRTPKDFWNWCDNGLIPGLHATSLYSNRRITWMESRFISNRATFVAGPARIRQLRFKQGPCIISNEPSAPSLAPRDCISTYSVLSQETRDFSPKWSDETQNTSSSTSPWVFQSSGDLGGFPYYGLRNLYDGGGYAVTLGNTAKSSRAKLATLERESWIDRHTAAVFIEFTVYNANVNLFGSVVLLLERSPNGAFFGFPVISPLRLYEFIDGKGYFLFPIYIIFVLVLTYNLQAIIRQIMTERKKYFQNFWKFVDFIIAAMSLVAIAIYAVRFVHANLTLSKITADVDKETFVNFQYIVLWNDTFRFLLAFTVFLATVKFSKLLHFNRRIRLLALTLKHAAKPVLYFTSMFSFYFVAFMFLAHIWFEQKLYTHSTWYLTAEELFSMLLGRFDFTQLQSADQLLGPLFFIAFTGSLTITILNMFICILDESIKKARADLEHEHNEFEVVDYMVKQLSSTLYANLPKFIRNTAKTEENAIYNLPIYIEFPEDVLKLRIDELESHVTKMETEFYATVTLEELEAELDDENHLFDDIV